MHHTYCIITCHQVFLSSSLIFVSYFTKFKNNLHLIFLGRHSLMAGLRIPFQFFGERSLPLYLSHWSPFFHFSFVFFICIICKKESPGVTEDHQERPRETWGDQGRPLDPAWPSLGPNAGTPLGHC